MNLIKKVSIVLLCLMVFSFCVPKIVRAEDGFGGKLLNPVMSLATALGDATMHLVQKHVVGITNTFLEINTDKKNESVLSAIGNFFSRNWKFIVAGVLAIGAVVVNVIPVAGQAASVALAIAAEALVGMSVAVAVYGVVEKVNTEMLPATLVLPTYEVTAKEIFSNEIPLIDVDFFNPTESEFIEYVDDNGDTQKKELYSTSGELQKTISKWYQILRDIAVVASLSILVYIGIRILISSTSNDKAKYKQMIVDWVVALCLLFIMQYIMSFSNIIVDRIIDIVSSINTHDYKPSDFNYSDDYEISVEEGFQIYTITDEVTVYNAYKKFVESWAEENGKEESEAPMYNFFTFNGDKAVSFYWPANNEMEQARINAQLLNQEKKTWESIGYKIIYCVLVVFTFIFLCTYIRRVLYMAFLTMIAPLVAMTYPIDKINDGKAQAFDMWLKEYIFNLLIQPMHLVLYTVLIGTAMDLASNNIIYVVCALGFMVPAEKLMRRFFGFENARTPGLLAGPAGAAMMMTGMNKLLSHGPKGGQGKDSLSKSGSSDSEKDNKINTHKNFDTDGVFADNNEMDNEKVPKKLNEENEQKDEKENTDLQQVSDTDMNESETSDDNSNEKQVDKSETSLNDNSSENQINESTSRSQKEGNKNKSERHPIRAIGRSGLRYVSGQNNKNKLSKMAGRAVLGGIGGTIGLAAGIASGDPSKAFQYTTAGITGGYKAGSGIVNRVANIPKARVSDGFKKDFYGEKEYEKRQTEQEIKQKTRDLELKWMLRDKYGKETAKKYMDNFVPKAVEYGVGSDNKTIEAMIEMQEKKGYTENEAIAAALISDRDLDGKDYDTRSGKAKKEFEDTLRKRGEERSLKGDTLEKFVKNQISAVKDLDNIRYK